MWAKKKISLQIQKTLRIFIDFFFKDIFLRKIVLCFYELYALETICIYKDIYIKLQSDFPVLMLWTEYFV